VLLISPFKIILGAKIEDYLMIKKGKLDKIKKNIY
jgi:hypothetical protein